MGIFRRRRDGGRDGRWVILGLGNPGERYENTRHNAGAMVVALLADRASSRLKSHRSGCLVAEGRLEGEPVVLARPTSYMNESGRPVRRLLDWYGAAPERLVVVHDEIDLPYGVVKIKSGGGTAGHNGLRSLVQHLGTNGFLRVRFGVSRPRGREATVGHVLDAFSGGERKELPDLLGRAADAVELVLTAGPERAMNEVNTKG